MWVFPAIFSPECRRTKDGVLHWMSTRAVVLPSKSTKAGREHEVGRIYSAAIVITGVHSLQARPVWGRWMVGAVNGGKSLGWGVKRLAEVGE